MSARAPVAAARAAPARGATPSAASSARMPARVQAALAAGGAPLSPALREIMAGRLGGDLSGIPARLRGAPSRVAAADDPGERLADRAGQNAAPKGPASPDQAAALARVRVHTGPMATAAARALRAEAFTLDNHLVFGAGAWRPETAAGRVLIAHELAHAARPGPAGSVWRKALADVDADRDADSTDQANIAAEANAPESAPRETSAVANAGPVAPATPAAPAPAAPAPKVAAASPAPGSQAPAADKAAAPPPGVAEMATGDLGLIDEELAEHERWGAAAAEVGQAGSEERAGFIAHEAAGGAVHGAKEGVKGGVESTIKMKVAEKVVEKAAIATAVRFGAKAGAFKSVPGVGPVIGGALAAYELAHRDWGKTGEAIAGFGKGADIYDALANTIEAISTGLEVATQVANVIAGILGVIVVVSWIAAVASGGVLGPLATLLSSIAIKIGVISLVMDAINALVLKELITTFRALHAFASEADPRDVVAQGAAIEQAAGGATGFATGFAAGMAADKGLHHAAAKVAPKLPGHPLPPAAGGEGPHVTAKPPPEGGPAPAPPETSPTAAGAAPEPALPAPVEASAEVTAKPAPKVAEPPTAAAAAPSEAAPATKPGDGAPAPATGAEASPATETASAPPDTTAAASASDAPPAAAAEAPPPPLEVTAVPGPASEAAAPAKPAPEPTAAPAAGETAAASETGAAPKKKAYGGLEFGEALEPSTSEIEQVRLETIGERARIAGRGRLVEQPFQNPSKKRPPALRRGEGRALPDRPIVSERVKADLRAKARERFGKQLQEALRDEGKHTELTQKTAEYLTPQERAYVLRTGKLPKTYDFHHLMTIAEFPEFGDRPEVGLGLPKEVHEQAGHGGDTAKPLEAMTFQDPAAEERPGYVEDAEAEKGHRVKQAEIAQGAGATPEHLGGVDVDLVKERKGKIAKIKGRRKPKPGDAAEISRLEGEIGVIEGLLAAEKAKGGGEAPSAAPDPDPSSPTPPPASHSPPAAATAQASAPAPEASAPEPEAAAAPEPVDPITDGAPNPTRVRVATPPVRVRAPQVRVRAPTLEPDPHQTASDEADAAELEARSAAPPLKRMALPSPGESGAARGGGAGWAAGPAALRAGRAAPELKSSAPVTERVNPPYQPPPATPDEIVSLRNQVIDTLAARANAESFARLMGQQEKHHAANEKPLAAMTAKTDEAITATAAHKAAVAHRQEANDRKAAEEAKARAKLDDYDSRSRELVAIKWPLKGVQKFTGLAAALPDDPDTVAGFKRGMLKMNVDAGRFIGKLDDVDRSIASQKADNQARQAAAKADASTLDQTKDKAGAAGEKLDGAKAATAEVDSANKDRLEQAKTEKQGASKTAAALGAQAGQKQSQADGLAAALKFWAQGHRKARVAAVEQTRIRLQSQGWQVTEVSGV